MFDAANSQDTSLSSCSCSMRVKTIITNYIKSEIGLLSKDEKSALEEIEKIFNAKDSANNLEAYFLRRSRWKLPMQKGADMITEEALLEIKRVGTHTWSVKRIGGFVKVL